MAKKIKLYFNKQSQVKYIPKEGDYFTYGGSEEIYQCFPRDYGMRCFQQKGENTDKLYALCLSNLQVTWFAIPEEFIQLIPSGVEKGAIIFEQA
jgi:hypothetical protein